MGVLTVTEMIDLALDRIQANVSVDPAFTDTELMRYLNDAYADVWEMSGGAMKRVAGGTLWTPQPAASTDGILTSVLTDIGEVKDLLVSSNSGSTGDVVAGDQPLDPVDLAEVMFLREHESLFGAYARPRVYALTRNFSTLPADVNKLRLDVWPGKVGAYFPTHYVPQFVALDYVGVTVPSVNDIESRDIYLLAAAAMAPRAGRTEFVPDILKDISQRTQAGLARKQSALLDARADR